MALVSIPFDIEQPHARGCSAVLSSPPHIPAPYAPPLSGIAHCTSISVRVRVRVGVRVRVRVRVSTLHIYSNDWLM